MTPTTAELIFWTVCLVIGAIFIFIVFPLINRWYENKDTERMFAHYTYTEYHDDMEDYE